MPFEHLMNDKVFVLKADGRRLGPFQSVLSKDKCTIQDKRLDVDPGDTLVRPLPNGKEESFLILRADFREDFHSIPGGYDLVLQKTQQIVQDNSRVVNNVNISNSSGIQIGNHNFQSVQIALNQLLQAIESSNSSQEEKEGAKSKLRELLEHPLVVAVLGGISGGLGG